MKQQTIGYDYGRQVWVVRDGTTGKLVYDDCGHPPTMQNGQPCHCFGRVHAGEVIIDAKRIH